MQQTNNFEEKIVEDVAAIKAELSALREMLSELKNDHKRIDNTCDCVHDCVLAIGEKVRAF